MNIVHEIDFKIEAIILLNKICDEVNDYNIFDNFKSYGIDSQLLEQLFKKYFVFNETVIKNLPKIEERFKLYFQSTKYNEGCLLKYFYLFYKHHQDYHQAINQYYQELLFTFANQEYSNLTFSTLVN